MKSKLVLYIIKHQTVKEHGGVKVYLPAFLTLALCEVNGQLHSLGALPPGKESPVCTQYTAGWAPETVQTLWRREKSLSLVRNI
jgi:hypothetical protein